MLNGIVLRICADIVNGIVEQIAFARLNFPDSPILAADILFCGKLAVLICGVGVDQLVTVIDTVLCACESGVALCLLCFGVGLFNGYGKLFENVGKLALSRLIPNNRCGL